MGLRMKNINIVGIHRKICFSGGGGGGLRKKKKRGGGLPEKRGGLGQFEI